MKLQAKMMVDHNTSDEEIVSAKVKIPLSAYNTTNTITGDNNAIGPSNTPKKYRNDIINNNSGYEIDVRPYYDSNDKAIYIPIITSCVHKNGTSNFFLTKCKISRELIMECIRDC